MTHRLPYDDMRRIEEPASLGAAAWIQVVRIHYRPGDAYDLHDHAFAEVFWIESGIADHVVNGVVQRLQPGTLVLMRPADAHAYSTVDGFVMVNVTFRARLLDEVAARYAAEFPSWPWGDADLPTQVRLGAPALERLQACAEELADDNSRLAAEGFLVDVLRIVRRAHRPAGMPAWLELAVESYLRPEHMSEGPDAFARLCARAPAHVNRVVRASFGCTATELVNRLRLEQAARMLKLSDHGIAAIAAGCGYASLAHFYRAFSARFGVTPRDFRRGHQAVGRSVPETWRQGRPVPLDRPSSPGAACGRV